MRRHLSILALFWLCIAPCLGQASNPFSPNAAPVQGPDPTGNLGYPVSTVPAPGSNSWPVSITGGTPCVGTVSVSNSTTTPLLANQTFTGAFEPVTCYSSLETYIDTSTNTQGTLILQWSADGVFFDFSDSTAVTPTLTGTQTSFDWPIKGRFFRLIYQNAGTNQNFFKLYTIFRSDAKEVSLQHQFSPAGSGLGTVGRWVTILANAAAVGIFQGNYTGAQQSSPSVNPNYRGAQFELDVTSMPAGGGLDLAILGEDANGNLTQLNTAQPGTVTTTGTFRWILYPGANGTATGSGVKQVISVPLPPLFKVQVTPIDGQQYGYSVVEDLNQ